MKNAADAPVLPRAQAVNNVNAKPGARGIQFKLLPLDIKVLRASDMYLPACS